MTTEESCTLQRKLERHNWRVYPLHDITICGTCRKMVKDEEPQDEIETEP